jgi:RNA 3'-terminal phosphate cyclase
VPELSPEGTAELMREMERPPADTLERRATFARVAAWAERERAAQEERIREIVREEIAAYWASVGQSQGSAVVVNIESEESGDALLERIERAARERMARGCTMRRMRDRDEPPAVDWL